MISSRWTKTFLLALTGLVVLLIGVYAGGVYYLHTTLETRLSQSTPGEVKIDDLDIKFLPFRVELNNTTLARPETPERPLAVFPKTTVKPRLSTLVSDTPVLKRITLTDPSVSLVQAEKQGTPLTFARDVDGSTSGGAFVFPIDVEKLRVEQGVFEYYGSQSAADPFLNFDTITFVTGPITDHTLREGIGFKGRFAPGKTQDTLKFGLTLSVLEELVVSGRLRANQVEISSVNRFLGDGFRLPQGLLSGVLPFEVTPERLRTRKTTLRVENARAQVGYTPEVQPETRPIRPEEVAKPDTKVRTRTDTDPSFDFDIGEVRLEVLDSSIKFLNRPDSPLVELTRATVLAGPIPGADTTFPVKGQMLLRDPPGLAQLKVRASPLIEFDGFPEFLAYATIDDVGALDRFFEDVIPIKLKGGELDVGARGALLEQNVDLTVDLDFRNLQSGSITDSKSSILGIPINLFVRYLKENNGNMNVPFHVSGTMKKPVFDTTGIRTRMLVNLGVDAAVMGTLGVPVYLGGELLERASGIDLVGTVKNTVGNVLGTDPRRTDPIFKLKELSDTAPAEPSSKE